MRAASLNARLLSAPPNGSRPQYLPGNHSTNDTLVLVITTFRPLLSSFVRMAAGKFDLAVFLGSVDAEDRTQDLLDHGVDTLDQLATLTEDKLREWKIYDDDLPLAIAKAQRLIRSSDAVVQEELLVSDTNLMLEKKDWGLSISVGQAKGKRGHTTTCEGV